MRSAADTVLTAPARALAATIDPDVVAADVTAQIKRTVFAGTDEEFDDALHVSVRDNIRAIFDVLAGRTEIAATTADGAIAFAQIAAELGVPFSLVDRAYRIGVATMWASWFALATEHARTTGTPLPELLGAPSARIFGYVDHILLPVNAAYDAARDELARTRQQLRRSVVAQLVDGSLDAITPDVEATLDYRLGGVHVALLVHTDGGEPAPARMAAIRTAYGARGVLAFHHGARSWLMWLGRHEAPGAGDLEMLRRAVAASGLTAAVGEPAAGLEGLRATRRQALEAGAVQHALGVSSHPCVWASDLRLELLLLAGDNTRARRFVADELGPLAGDDDRAGRLRETLRAWFASGSHGGAAGLLGVHKNTVRNRLRDTEEMLGRSLWARSTELQVALRLDRILRAGGESEP